MSHGGAAGLVQLVNAHIGAAVNACDMDVNVLNDVLNNSLNSLLENADIHVLENILNNSPLLSGNDNCRERQWKRHRDFGPERAVGLQLAAFPV